MKNLKNIYTLIFSLALMFAIQGCETDFVNPNSPSEDQVLSTREGLLNLTVAIQQEYSTRGIRWMVETPAITTREGGITTTFQNMIELEDGGTALPNFNSNVRGLWATMAKVIGMSEDLINNAGSVQLEAGTQTGMVAWGHLYKAMAISALAMNYENIIITTSEDGNTPFVSRQAGFEEAVNLLEQADALLSGSTLSGEFEAVSSAADIDLGNVIKAMLARNYLFSGQYSEAISMAGSVDVSSLSQFRYDTQNPNPIWGRVFQGGTPNFKPRDNFGLPASFSFDSGDGRVPFYLDPSGDTNQNGLDIEELKGFFTSDVSMIPVFLPGEMQLIIAEGHVRKSSPDLNAAQSAIDMVLMKTTDPSGVNAGLSSGYSGPMTANALLDEIFRNRRAELFLTGMSLEDSRRFNRPQPSTSTGVFTDERNRNFYPYPDRERANNSNTPSDPAI